MKKLVFILILVPYCLFSQIRPLSMEKTKALKQGQFSNRLDNNNSLDSLSNKAAFKVALSEKTTYKDYKKISFAKDTVYIDTTLTIKKDYKFNYLRKDAFELIPFHNQGQTFNKLGYKFDKENLYPNLGASAKQFNFYEVEDIAYYQVATPFTELAYRKGLEQGQSLDALITVNLNKSTNFSLEYKGLRSLGKYRHSLASHENLRLTHSYESKNKKYQVRSHLTAQEIFNEENGGLLDVSILNFEGNIEDFKDRGRLETHFTDADNLLRSNRYYIDHSYNLIVNKDSISTKFKIKLGHVFTYKTKHYQYGQVTKDSIYFGESFTSKISDASHLTELYNQLNVNVDSDKILGSLLLFVENYQSNIRFNNRVTINNALIPQNRKEAVFSAGANWHTSYKSIAIRAKAATTISGNLRGNFIKAIAIYKKDSLLTLKATILNNSKSPNYNFLINQSDYQAYNWNNTDFKNELTNTLLFELKSNKLLNASAQITQLNNYTYFNKPAVDKQTKPEQYDGTVNYLKIKASKSISYKWFTIDNTVMYQKVAAGASVFKIPELVTRNTLYYSNSIFKKKPMYIQTGVTFKYFTKYYANSYNPLLSEFYLQDQVEIGNYPMLDVFINARVRNMRLFVKAEHINTLISNKRNYYAAPNYPYRDYTLRFGIVWNFFM